MKFILQEVIKGEKLIQLRDELLPQLPESELVSRLINMKIRYPLKVEVYRHSARNDSSDLVIVTGAPSSKTLPSINIFWRDDLLSEEETASVLETLPNWNWKGAMCVHAVTDEYSEKVKQLFQNKKLVGDSLEFGHVIPQSSYLLKTEKVDALPDVRLPAGFKFGVIHPHQLQTIFEAWDCSWLLDLKTFQENVTFLPTVAIYKTDDEYESMPISWMVLHDVGNIGFAYTHPDFRGMGFCRLVLTKLSKLVAERGHEVSLMAIDDKKDAIAFYKNFGFEESVHNNCCFFLPKGASLQDYTYNRTNEK